MIMLGMVVLRLVTPKNSSRHLPAKLVTTLAPKISNANPLPDST